MTGTKIIKRYQDRKLYDTEDSVYMTLDQLDRLI
jgi:polyhydroxyalkanoate synthesis regulator protein